MIGCAPFLRTQPQSIEKALKMGGHVVCGREWQNERWAQFIHSAAYKPILATSALEWKMHAEVKQPVGRFYYLPNVQLRYIQLTDSPRQLSDMGDKNYP